MPEALSLLGEKSCEHNTSGGWLLGGANMLVQHPDIALSIAFVSTRVRDLKVLRGEKITYYVIPFGKGNTTYNEEYEKYWVEIKTAVNPDVINIHGTEFTHGLSYMRACGNDKVVISIQGLISACCEYYSYGMSKKDLISCRFTPRDIVKGSIDKERQKFRVRGIYEKEMIRLSKHIIGRTSWDRARTWAINPDATYHFCNETLRGEFYSGSHWEYDKCVKHSIFISAAHYPLKGLHQLLKAMPLILARYPDTIVHVAGGDITKCEKVSDLMHFTGYGLYIKRLIRRLHLQGKIIFLGHLTAGEMKAEYMRSNVFVCPSSIENGSNSLGEAQILGVPNIASYVGGIPNTMKGNEENMYRFEEIDMLAEKVCRVFRDGELQTDMSEVAARRHDPDVNAKRMIEIYEEISKS